MDSTADQTYSALATVQAAVLAGSAPLRLTELATATGLEVSAVSAALLTLEHRGAVRFHRGRWLSRIPGLEGERLR